MPRNLKSLQETVKELSNKYGVAFDATLCVLIVWARIIYEELNNTSETGKGRKDNLKLRTFEEIVGDLAKASNIQFETTESIIIDWTRLLYENM
jgi:hypothetical protein